MNDFLAVIPTRTNIDGLQGLLSHLDRLGVPARIYDNGHETYSAQAYLNTRPDVVNARSWMFYRMWNDGWRFAAENGYKAVAMLNDDITLHHDSLRITFEALEANPTYGLVGLNWKRRVKEGAIRTTMVQEANGSYRKYGIGGWAFMIRAELWGAVPPIDELYNIWYGDDELFALMPKHGYKTGLAVGAPVDHEMSSTLDKFPELRAKTGSDRERFIRRWGDL